MKKPNPNRFSISKKMWFKIRYWQNMLELTDVQLASFIGVCDKTLRALDKNCGTMTIDKVENFIVVNNMTFEEFWYID